MHLNKPFCKSLKNPLVLQNLGSTMLFFVAKLFTSVHILERTQSTFEVFASDTWVSFQNATALFYSDELVLIIYLCSMKFSKVWGISKLRIRTEYWFVFGVIFKLTLSTRMNICNTYVFPYLADLSWCILLDAEVYWLP